MRTTHIVVASTLLAGLMHAATIGAQTNGFAMHCLSARAAGQGCVTRARADVPTDLFRDPASIAWFQRPALEVNLSGFAPSLTFRNTTNSNTADGANHVFPLASFAYVGNKPAPRLSWAVGMEPIGGFGSDFKLQHALLGAQQDYESFFAALKMGPAVAYEVAPGFSIGASGYATYAQIRYFRMPFTMPPQAAAGLGLIMQMDEHYPAMFSNITELTAYGNSTGFGGWGWGTSVGAAWKVNDDVRLSASWNPRSKVSLTGASATIDMTRQFQAMYGMMVQERVQNHGMTASEAQAYIGQALGQGGMNLALGTSGAYEAATELSEPQTAGVGLNLNAGPRWNIAVEGVWMGWSSAESVMPFILSKGSNPNVNILVNGDPANGSFTYPFPLRWKDTWSGKMGVAYRATAETMLRAGYLYGTNPVPENAVFIAFPAISSQALTAGAGFKLLGLPFEVSLVHALSASETGAASGHLLGAEYQNSHTTMQQNVITFGAVWRY